MAMTGTLGAPARAATAALAHVLPVCYMGNMKTLNLRDANQRFSQLVREVQETGEGVVVLRNGEPAVEIVPAGKNKPRRLSFERQKAIEALLEAARNNRSQSDPTLPRMTRDEMHER